ncbi:acyl carrier protein [Microtetraspora malaysiensis]|uniref:Acyl carrier protein n=1 Tax=Microtetraspora malaysiensis TaxID=161358 RepID=A0ABW6SVQ3_9ACTN
MAQVTRCEPPREDLHLNLLGDLGVDSLALLELVEILEKRFRVSIPDEDTGQIRTLADLTSVIHRLTSTDPTSTQIGTR